MSRTARTVWPLAAALLLLLIGCGAQPGRMADVAGAAAQQVTVGGQVRPRLEARDPAGGDGRSEAFTSLRTRLSASALLEGGATVFVQIQDVRLFGEESSTLADHSADALDVHQAWIQLGAEEGVASFRVGRQEVSLGGQRLVGAVDWTQQGRAFDGARLRIGEGGARVRADVFAFQLSESASPSREGDAAFLGGYVTLHAGPARPLELYLLRNRAGAGDAVTEEVTAGVRWVASAGPMEYRLEGAWQMGERAGSELDAWFVGARAGAPFAGGAARWTLWYDHLSGDGPGDGAVGSFSTLFATNHKFYGSADLFLDVPAHTAGRGLRDAAVKFAWTPDARWSAGLDLHRFLVAEDGGLPGSHLADEADVTVDYRLGGGARLSGGLALVRAGEALGPVRGIDGDVRVGWLTLDVVF